MSHRLNKFQSFETHPWLKKTYKKLTIVGKVVCENFIKENEHLDKNEFESEVNRMFLETNRPKDFGIILELLSCANS